MRRAILGVIAICGLAASAAAQATTAFTYNGNLASQGFAANGIYDFRFVLFGVASGGSPASAPVDVDNLAVANGVFSTELNFGSAPFSTGSDLWLEVAVRDGASNGSYTVFVPRQHITPTPYALSAANLSSSTAELNLFAAGDRMARFVRPPADGGTGWFSPNLIGGYAGNSVGAIVGATIGGGGREDNANSVTAHFGTVGGGLANTAAGANATVAGGSGNIASGTSNTIAGGLSNTASGSYATVGGGQLNQATGSWSVVPGGYGNLASNINSYAAGQSAQAVHAGTFVWADSSAGALSSSNFNQVTMRAANGYRLFTNSTITTGVVVAAGGGSWSSASDRALKHEVRALNEQEVLRRLVAVPITEWSYKSQSPSIRHVGPMAQDFFAAFGLGEDDTHIGTIDADGVMMAAIQGLYRAHQEMEAAKNAEIAALEARVKRLEQLLTTQKEQ